MTLQACLPLLKFDGEANLERHNALSFHASVFERSHQVRRTKEFRVGNHTVSQLWEIGDPNNLNYGIQVQGNAQVFIRESKFVSTGFRVGGPSDVTSPGHAISYEGFSSGEVAQTQITGSAGRGLSNTGVGAVTYYELFFGDNAGGNIFNATRNNTP